MEPSAYPEHRRAAEPILARCATITLSDTRTLDTDTGGQTLRRMLTEAGHTLLTSELIPDDPTRLRPLLDTLLSRNDLDLILTTGGTGISRRDQTVGVIQSLLTLPLDGFGELFRMLSYQQIGSGAMLSRALGGVAAAGSAPPKLLFALPGSPAAVELAMAQLILPELKHLLRELRK